MTPSTQPMPAAAASGVTPSFVLIFGSAPRSSSSRMSSTSPDCEARRNAVAPSSSSHWFVKTVRVSVLSINCAFTFAPASSSSSMYSRSSMSGVRVG